MCIEGLSMYVASSFFRLTHAMEWQSWCTKRSKLVCIITVKDDIWKCTTHISKPRTRNKSMWEQEETTVIIIIYTKSLVTLNTVQLHRLQYKKFSMFRMYSVSHSSYTHSFSITFNWFSVKSVKERVEKTIRAVFCWKHTGIYLCLERNAFGLWRTFSQLLMPR